MSLNGKTLFITGASRGIGEEIAKLFASEGAKVVCAARTLNEGDRVSFECSPVQRIHVVADERQYQTTVCELGENKLTSYSPTLQGTAFSRR